MTPKPFDYVDTQEGWEACLEALQPHKRLAVDLEANSLYAYRERICLIQLSTSEKDYIVDPLADLDLTPFGTILANPEVEKIFHSCEYDLILLQGEFGWEVCNLFDTMWAARVLGYKNMGLAWFLREFYDVEVSKKHQKANWAKRPLTPEMLDYAQKDTYYLLRLRDDLSRDLEEKGRMAEAREIFAEQCRVRMPDRTFDPERYRSIRGARDLNGRAQAVLRALYVFRDAEAGRRDQPPFKILSNEAMIRITQALPASRKELMAVKGVSDRMVSRLGAGILKAVEEGMNAPLPPAAKRRRRGKDTDHDPEAAERFERLSNWRKELARERGVESDVILSREAMWEIARSNAATLESLARLDSIGPHRLSLHGDAIVQTLAEFAQQQDSAEDPVA